VRGVSARRVDFTGAEPWAVHQQLGGVADRWVAGRAGPGVQTRPWRAVIRTCSSTPSSGQVRDSGGSPARRSSSRTPFTRSAAQDHRPAHRRQRNRDVLDANSRSTTRIRASRRLAKVLGAPWQRCTVNSSGASGSCPRQHDTLDALIRSIFTAESGPAARARLADAMRASSMAACQKAAPLLEEPRTTSWRSPPSIGPT
jgi:hypothetical protein